MKSGLLEQTKGGRGAGKSETEADLRWIRHVHRQQGDSQHSRPKGGPGALGGSRTVAGHEH